MARHDKNCRSCKKKKNCRSCKKIRKNRYQSDDCDEATAYRANDKMDENIVERYNPYESLLRYLDEAREYHRNVAAVNIQTSMRGMIC